MKPQAKRQRAISPPPVDAFKKLTRFGDVSAHLINGTIPERARLLLEGLSCTEACAYFKRKHGMQLLETLARIGSVQEFRFLFETLGFREVILQKHGRWLVSIAMEADTPCVATIRYLIQQGFSVDTTGCKLWIVKRCSVTHLRRIVETFFELVPDLMVRYGAILVQELYSSIQDRYLRTIHMEALQGLVQLTAQNAALICRTRTSPDRGARIAQIIEENTIAEQELVEIYELVELFAHLEAEVSPETFSFLRKSISLRQRLALPNKPYEYQGRKLIDSLDEVDVLEAQMAKGNFTDSVWQLLLIATKHGLVYNAMRWQYFKNLKNAEDVAATKDFVMCIVGMSVNNWFLPKIGMHYGRLLTEHESPLVALRKLYFFLQTWFETKPERRSPHERALFVIVVRLPLRMVRSAEIEEQLHELRGKLDEVLFVLSFALSIQQVPQQILRTYPSYGAPLTAIMLRLVWLLIRRGASLSRLPQQSQSTLRTLLDNSSILPKTIREELAKRICCPLALVWSDRGLFEKIADPKKPARLHCLALAACKNLPRSYFKGKISQRGLQAVSRHRPLI